MADDSPMPHCLPPQSSYTLLLGRQVSTAGLLAVQDVSLRPARIDPSMSDSWHRVYTHRPANLHPCVTAAVWVNTYITLSRNTQETVQCTRPRPSTWRCRIANQVIRFITRVCNTIRPAEPHVSQRVVPVLGDRRSASPQTRPVCSDTTGGSPGMNIGPTTRAAILVDTTTAQRFPHKY